ncbi:hypothetical protein [Chitiniphilus shinanonensis]|uniref:hypothetical protein n=1 Tax=Chitiniphilus shinanonensis TaxID=553088 RepID=UPI0030358E10
MKKRTLISSALLALAIHGNASAGSYDIMNKYMKLYYSGCYQVGTTVAEYEKCMEANGWAKLDKDATLKSYCTMMPRSDSHFSECTAMVKFAAERYQAALDDAAADAFVRAFQARNDVQCFTPDGNVEEFTTCLERLGDENKIKREVQIIDRIRDDANTLQRAKSFDTSSGYDRKFLLPEKKQAALQLADQITKNKQEIAQAEQEREAVERQRLADAAIQEQLDYEANLQKKCGDDYLSARIGMSEKRLIECAEARLVAENGKSIRVYRTSSGVTVRVVNGKVTAWLGR